MQHKCPLISSAHKPELPVKALTAVAFALVAGLLIFQIFGG